jgi:glycosyltransferase involved in cell wall biosynthesis
MIARCDGGGLAALTREVHRHLKPERTLLLDLEGAGRGGECVPDDYLEGEVYRCGFAGGLPDRAVEWLTAEGIDTLWTAETFYDDHKLIRRAHGNGMRTIVYAMPELAPWQYDPSIPPPRVFTVPTAWRLETMPPNTQILPMPVARDRLPPGERREVRHLYHVAGAAMLDRNGTQILLDALEHVVSDDLTLTIRTNGPTPMVPLGTRVHVEVLLEQRSHYWESYPADIDLLVQPRRYGGLSLPVQECASLGVPTVCLATDPYASEAFTTTIMATSERDSRMKGGMIPVQSADPRALARAIDFLVEHPDVQHTASIEAGVWAEAHAWWGPLGDRWCATLGCERR